MVIISRDSLLRQAGERGSDRRGRTASITKAVKLNQKTGAGGRGWGGGVRSQEVVSSKPSLAPI